MLLSLKIENIAIIESADIEFDSGPRGLKNMISSPTRTAIYFFAEPSVWTAKTPAA